jgi:hypothetical protein
MEVGQNQYTWYDDFIKSHDLTSREAFALAIIVGRRERRASTIGIGSEPNQLNRGRY